MPSHDPFDNDCHASLLIDELNSTLHQVFSIQVPEEMISTFHHLQVNRTRCCQWCQLLVNFHHKLVFGTNKHQ